MWIRVAVAAAVLLLGGCESRESQLEKCTAAYGSAGVRACLIMKYDWTPADAVRAEYRYQARVDSASAAFEAGQRAGESERLYGPVPTLDTAGLPIHGRR